MSSAIFRRNQNLRFISNISSYFSTAAALECKVDVKLVSQLRKETGFPIGKCKEALLATLNDYKKSQNWLLEQQKKHGWAQVQKLAGRTSQEGLVSVKSDSSLATLLEVKCETDFVARNETFKNFAAEATAAAFFYAQANLDASSQGIYTIPVEDILNLKNPKSSQSLLESLTEVVGKLRENVFISSVTVFPSKSQSRLGVYVHDNISLDSSVLMGRIAGVVSCELNQVPENVLELENFQKRLAQHIVGLGPKSILPENLPADSDSSEALFAQNYLFDGVPIQQVIQRESQKLNTQILVNSFLVKSVGKSIHDSL